MVVTALHPFLPGLSTTQCSLWGCWGWVDDPRHVSLLAGRTPEPRPPAPKPRPYTTPRGRRRKTIWSRYAACTRPRCKARPGWPCRRLARSPFEPTTVKVRPHDGRPLLKARADA